MQFVLNKGNKGKNMKKIILTTLTLLTMFFSAFTQNYVSEELGNEIYNVLDYAKLKGVILSLSGNKPYPKKMILKAVDEILESGVDFSQEFIQLLNDYKSKNTLDDGKKNSVVSFRFQNSKDSKVHVLFLYDSSNETIASGGLYNKKSYSQWGFDNLFQIRFRGNIGDNFSYMIKAVADLTRMPLVHLSDDYLCGYAWYDTGSSGSQERTIKKYLNTAYLPYSYSKRWNGQMQYLENMSASGLEGWAFKTGLGVGVESEMRTSFLDDKIIVGGGRFRREIAGMSEGSSLVLNSKAQPFFSVDFQANPFSFIKYTSVTGILEYPSQDYINKNYLPKSNPSKYDDTQMWQNAFSLNMIEIDTKHVHADFGGTVVWPKRFEIGYIFPLASYVEYQNHIGDCDNLSLFADLKLRLPNIGEVWTSFFIDEINSLNNNPFTDSRDMFAYQAGVKYVVPKLALATISFRYTKIEPYCYTHHAINYTPWYPYYISENYTNNGECLGYYLPPNSDEFLLKFDWTPISIFDFNASYQFIRHGADYGSQQVPGSSLYSEMTPYNRNSLKKYFLHDGAYNWIHVLSFGCKLNLSKSKVPVELYGNLGFIVSYYTMIDYNSYDKSGRALNGSNFNTPYSIVNTEEYPLIFGSVLTIGAKFSF